MALTEREKKDLAPLFRVAAHPRIRMRQFLKRAAGLEQSNPDIRRKVEK